MMRWTNALHVCEAGCLKISLRPNMPAALVMVSIADVGAEMQKKGYGALDTIYRPAELSSDRSQQRCQRLRRRFTALAALSPSTAIKQKAGCYE
ncbi:hypothetical protein ACLKA6_004510 [Drosophila palustris]